MSYHYRMSTHRVIHTRVSGAKTSWKLRNETRMQFQKWGCTLGGCSPCAHPVPPAPVDHLGRRLYLANFLPKPSRQYWVRVSALTRTSNFTLEICWLWAPRPSELAATQSWDCAWKGGTFLSWIPKVLIRTLLKLALQERVSMIPTQWATNWQWMEKNQQMVEL